MERATKLIVFGWTCAALAFEIDRVAAGWDRLPTLALVVFVISAASCAFEPRTAAVVIAPAYFYPVLMRAAAGGYAPQFSVLWMAGVLGAITPSALRSSWHVPAPWRAPLVGWALTISVASVVVVGRELDFNAALLDNPYLWSSSGGFAPPNVVVSVVLVALVLVLGVLWFDWLFGAPAHVLPWITGALGVSAAVMALVAVYQLVGDMGFLNPTVFFALGRATGTVFDANTCGTVAGLWVGGVLLCADRARAGRSVILALGLPLMWLAVWATRSRTAFAEAAIVSLFALVSVYDARSQPGRRLGPLRAVVIGGIVAAALVALTYAPAAAVGPLRRVWDTLPTLSIDSMRGFASEMWNRNRYGLAATAMIRQFPLFGVGVGSFQVLLPDFARLTGPPLPLDNAQNWYRHQFVEFGAVGSLGWLAWVAVFGRFVLTRRPSDPPGAWIARGMLVAFALISLVGMSGQEIGVALTFWTVAFWYVWLVGPPQPVRPAPRRAWAAVVTLLVVFTVGTTAAALGALRVPFRAQRAGWPYSYGFGDPLRIGDAEYKPVTGRAVEVVDASSGWMALTFLANPAGGSGRSRTVRAWCDGRLVVDDPVPTDPLTKLIRLRDTQKRVVLEVSFTGGAPVLDTASIRGPDGFVRWGFPDPPRER